MLLLNSTLFPPSVLAEDSRRFSYKTIAIKKFHLSRFRNLKYFKLKKYIKIYFFLNRDCKML